MNNSLDDNSNVQNDENLQDSISNPENNNSDSQLGDNNAEEEPPKEPQNPLKLDTIKKGLKNLSKTYNGLSYAYIRLDLKDKELDDIAEDLNNYIHLRDVDLSQNKFTHVNPVVNMNYLVRLDASKNEINNINAFTFPDKLQFLQILNLRENKIKELSNLTTHSLTELFLDNNVIKDCSNFKGLPNIKKLNLNQNKLIDCDGLINMPNLEYLYLNENEIKDIEGLKNLPKLRKLRLKTNKIEEFHDIPILPQLEKLNISENLIKNFSQFSHLKFPRLKKINVDSNPCFDEPNAGAKIEILIQLEDFEILAVNKEEVVIEDREEAKKLKEERIQKDKEEAEERERQRIAEEIERKQREEEERLEKEREEKERLEREEEERREREEEEKRQREEEARNHNEENEGDENLSAHDENENYDDEEN